MAPDKTDLPDPMGKVFFRGWTMSRKDAAFIAAMEEKLGFELTIVQGPYNPSAVPGSAGTHDKGGVFDFAPYRWRKKCKVGRELGGTHWHRPEIPGTWGEHIHGVMRGHQDLSPEASRQVVDYDQHLNGLANHAQDNQVPHPDGVVFSYAKWWHDQLLEKRIKGVNARIQGLLERLSAQRALKKRLQDQRGK